MKKTLTFLTLLFATTTLSAQTLYTRKETIAITQDSVTLHTGQFRGKVQWQHSLNGQQWNNLTNKTDSLLKVAKSAEGYYRAQITDGTCLPSYSDTAVVVITKTQNDLVISPDNISGATFIDRDDSIFTYIGTPDVAIPINTVLVDDKQESDIRVVTEVTQKGDTLKVKTEPGTMENLFVNQEFKLSTEMIAPTTKSAHINNMGLSKALTDKDGFIHPVEVIDLNASGAKLKSAAIDGEIPVANFSSDFSGEHLYNKNGLEILFTEGNFNMGCVFKCEFNFEQQKFLWTEMPTGKLKSCKFYTDKEKTGAKAKLILQAKASGEVSLDETFTLRPNVFRKLFEFQVGDVPVWMEVKIDLMARAVGSLGSTFSVTGGMSSDLGINLGASYEGGVWTPFFDYTKTFSLYGPDYDGHVNYDLRMEVYPRTEILFYSSLGPYLEVVPYLSEKMDYSISGNYNFGLYSGLDARVGLTGNILGYAIPPFGKEYNIRKDTIYQQPSKLEIVSGNNQEGTSGSKLEQPIVIKVVDSDNVPIPDMPVNFDPKSGTIDNTSPKTDKQGKVSVYWTLGNAEGEQTLETYIKDGNDKKLEKTVVTITSKSKTELPTVETYAASNITETSATYGGNVTDDGGADVTARGICWNTIGTPTTTDNKTSNGTGTGAFTSGLSGLTSNTTYYLRAYATNSKGTEYGNQVSFKTSGGRACTMSTFTDTRDGHSYKTVVIGTQTWMAENLAYLPYTTPTSTSSATSPCYYIYNYAAYGVLYNWLAAMNACPVGWHLPSKIEWTTLINYLGDGEEIPWVASSKMKNETGWLPAPETRSIPNNSSCFSALPGGSFYFYDGAFYGYIIDGNSGSWWNSTEYDSSNAWGIYIHFHLPLSQGQMSKLAGLSVRCIKN